MKRILLLAVGCVCLAFGAGDTSAVAGVWHAQADGVPALDMTISDEGGELTGAIVFYLIRHNDGQPPRSSPGGPTPMFNMKFDGRALDFRVSHRRAHFPRTANDPPVSFRLKITGPDEGVLVREGDESTTLRMVREKEATAEPGGSARVGDPPHISSSAGHQPLMERPRYRSTRPRLRSLMPRLPAAYSVWTRRLASCAVAADRQIESG